MSDEVRESQSPEQDLDQDLKKLQEERDSLFQRLARVTADFKNAQKRLEEDKKQAIEYANSHLITALLPVIDNFERALSVDQGKTDVAAILKGMQMIHDQWIAVLKAQHVDQIAPEAGEKFPKKESADDAEGGDFPAHGGLHPADKNRRARSGRC